MYKDHPVCELPDDETKIWRYMSLTKFVSLLHRQALFFGRVAGLQKDDPYEGAFPKNYDQPDLKRYFRQIGHADTVAVNCWHIGNYESAAMWKLYGDGGIAVQSTIGCLKKSFDRETREIYLGKVYYIDYEIDHLSSDEENMLSLCLHKRPSFEHERELRALMNLGPSPEVMLRQRERTINYLKVHNLLPEEDEQRLIREQQELTEQVEMELEKDETERYGTYVDVDLEILLDQICIPPTSQPWIEEAVRSLVEKYGFDPSKVRHSRLLEPPT
ncbi:MAG: DUF2971 domain-containing protein [Anaerolineae bacterium]|nr:DUF2971 domain-containing protein [Anaerolineae bacterium]